MNYKFQGFELQTDQRILIKQGQEIPITNKVYMFLVLLLKNDNRIVTKKTLEEVVWKGRIVTDTTIYQLVARLRNTLEDHEENEPIIQTVHGEGYRLLPAITSSSQAPVIVPKKTKSKLFSKGSFYKLIVVMLIILFWLYSIDKKAQEEPQVITSAQAMPLRVSLVPATFSSQKFSDTSTEWLFEGGMFYLAELLAKNSPLITQAPRKQWLEAEDKSALALDLLEHKSTDVVLLVDTGKDGDTYFSTIQIRDKNGITSSNSFSAISIRQLMAQASSWIQTQLQPLVTSENIVTQDLSKDEFAVESFIRGMSAQLQGDSRKAMKFFQLSTEQDPNFLNAWYELGIAHRKQGDYDRALAIFATLLQNPNKFTGRVNNAIGITHWRKGEYKLAEAALQTSLENARERGSRHLIRTTLTNLAILAARHKDYTSARKLLDEALTLIDPENDPYSYGTVMNNYAGIENKTNNNNKAVEYSRTAINAFARAGDLRYENTSKARLSGVFISMGRFSEGEALALQTLEFRRESEDRSGMVSSYNKLARAAVATGRFRLSESYWNKSLQLLIELGDRRDQGNIYASLADVYLRAGRLPQAAVQIKLLQDRATELDAETLRHRHQTLVLRLALAQGELQQATEMLALMDADKSAETALYQGDLLGAKGDYLAAETAYLKAATLMAGSGKNLVLTEIQNRLTNLYLETNIDKAQASIDKTEQFSPFLYPLMKYQAIVSHKQGQHFLAVSQLQQLKASANEFWQAQDQLLLEEFSGEL
ncbi:MAG: tetratricopeptide repeat protein [Xanthomonadales bacterium]|nr:tetratricopeptide repeat protein [Xanthomonadales bacterium]